MAEHKHFVVQKTLRSAVGTPICQIVPVSRAYVYGGGGSLGPEMIHAEILRVFYLRLNKESVLGGNSCLGL